MCNPVVERELGKEAADCLLQKQSKMDYLDDASDLKASPEPLSSGLDMLNTLDIQLPPSPSRTPSPSPPGTPSVSELPLPQTPRSGCGALATYQRQHPTEVPGSPHVEGPEPAADVGQGALHPLKESLLVGLDTEYSCAWEPTGALGAKSPLHETVVNLQCEDAAVSSSHVAGGREALSHGQSSGRDTDESSQQSAGGDSGWEEEASPGGDWAAGFLPEIDAHPGKEQSTSPGWWPVIGREESLSSVVDEADLGPAVQGADSHLGPAVLDGRMSAYWFVHPEQWDVISDWVDTEPFLGLPPCNDHSVLDYRSGAFSLGDLCGAFPPLPAFDAALYPAGGRGGGGGGATSAPPARPPDSGHGTPAAAGGADELEAFISSRTHPSSLPARSRPASARAGSFRDGAAGGWGPAAAEPAHKLAGSLQGVATWRQERGAGGVGACVVNRSASGSRGEWGAGEGGAALRPGGRGRRRQVAARRAAGPVPVQLDGGAPVKRRPGRPRKTPVVSPLAVAAVSALEVAPVDVAGPTKKRGRGGRPRKGMAGAGRAAGGPLAPATTSLQDAGDAHAVPQQQLPGLQGGGQLALLEDCVSGHQQVLGQHQEAIPASAGGTGHTESPLERALRAAYEGATAGGGVGRASGVASTAASGGRWPAAGGPDLAKEAAGGGHLGPAKWRLYHPRSAALGPRALSMKRRRGVGTPGVPAAVGLGGRPRRRVARGRLNLSPDGAQQQQQQEKKEQQPQQGNEKSHASAVQE